MTQISVDDQPVLQVAVTGPYDGFTMRSYAEDLKDASEKVAGVREVKISGGDEKEFEVAYDPGKLLFYGISADQANSAIAATNVSFPSGTFDSKHFQYSIRTNSKVKSVEDIAAISVKASQNGGVITIGQIASVNVKAIKKSTLARLSTKGSAPENAITLAVVKRTGSSILDTVAEVKTTLNDTIKTFKPGVRYDVTQDMAKEINKSFDELEHDFILTLILVFGILFIIVGLKEAFVAGLAIPLVFFATFASLLYLGISLNFLSLFSLILALSLIHI